MEDAFWFFDPIPVNINCSFENIFGFFFKTKMSAFFTESLQMAFQPFVTHPSLFILY